jgi:hypothetical protein
MLCERSRHSRLYPDMPGGFSFRTTHPPLRKRTFPYSLYVTHLPLITLTAGLILSDARMPPNAFGLACMVGISALCIAWAKAFSSMTERRTTQLRSYFKYVILENGKAAHLKLQFQLVLVSAASGKVRGNLHLFYRNLIESRIRVDFLWGMKRHENITRARHIEDSTHETGR